MAEILNCRKSPRSWPDAAKRRRPPGEVVEILRAPLDTPKKDVDAGSSERIRAGTTKRRFGRAGDAREGDELAATAIG